MAIGERYERILGAAESVIARRGFHQSSPHCRGRAREVGAVFLHGFIGGVAEAGADAAETTGVAPGSVSPALRRPA